MVADITKEKQAVVTAIQSKAPEATVIVTGIFPRNDKLADASGRLFDGMMSADNLHPSEKAYQVWADAPKSGFRELLGAPGMEDHSLPPTGNPGARR